MKCIVSFYSNGFKNGRMDIPDEVLAIRDTSDQWRRIRKAIFNKTHYPKIVLITVRKDA